jgi:hypothetical protein
MKPWMLAGVLSTLGAALTAVCMHVGAIAAEAGIAHREGGIGAEERAAMEAARGEYNLRLTFADKVSGAYRADVELEIRDAQAPGRPVLLQTHGAGPMLFAKLPPGRYEVKAKAMDRQQVRMVALPANGARELYFYWDGE